MCPHPQGNVQNTTTAQAPGWAPRGVHPSPSHPEATQAGEVHQCLGSALHPSRWCLGEKPQTRHQEQRSVTSWAQKKARQERPAPASLQHLPCAQWVCRSSPSLASAAEAEALPGDRQQAVHPGRDRQVASSQSAERALTLHPSLMEGRPPPLVVSLSTSDPSHSG